MRIAFRIFVPLVLYNLLAYGQAKLPTNDKKATATAKSAGPAVVDLCNHTHEGGNFTAQFPWYVRVIQKKVADHWLRPEPDPRVQSASRVCLNFDINRRGEPSNIRIVQSSGVPSLDELALRAVKGVSTFGWLPPAYEKDKITVSFWFDYKSTQGEQEEAIVSPMGQDISSAPEIQSQDPANSPDQKSQRQDYGLGTGAPGRQIGALDILSDTQGVDFGPYLQRTLQTVRENWYHLIPESASKKKGKLAIEFAITKDGKVADMRLVATSGDAALDRPAWGCIRASEPFPPFPIEFTGPYLALRFRFYYNPDMSDLEGPFKPFKPNFVEAAHMNETAPPATPLLSATSAPSKAGVMVTISSSGDSKTTAGEARIMTPTVTGTEKQAVKWSISGQGCSNSSCGVMVGNLYLAPKVPPIPNEVTLTVVSEADPTAKASVIVHIVEPTLKTVSKP